MVQKFVPRRRAGIREGPLAELGPLPVIQKSRKITVAEEQPLAVACTRQFYGPSGLNQQCQSIE